MNILYVGDPHVTVSNLEDSQKLFQFVYDTAKKEKVDRIVLLGDLYHTHAVVRVEVQNFWNRILIELSANFETVVLMGNHDMVNQKLMTSESALEVHKHINNTNLTIVTEPVVLGNFGYLPYIHDSKVFVETANELAKKTNILICHFTPDGAKYENGFYAPDGIDQNLLDHKEIISGHIHMEGTYGKVWIPGTPKWDSASDANQNKGIWVCGHNSDGFVACKTFYSTWGIVTPIVSLIWEEGQEQPEVPTGTKASVEIIGSNLFVSKAKALFKGTAKVKTKVTDRVIRENRKASASILDFLDNNYKTTVNRDKLKSYLKEKQYV